jgi:hypothetical protein
MNSSTVSLPEKLRNWLRSAEGIRLIDLEAKLLVKAVDRFDLPDSIHPFLGLDEDDKRQEAWSLIWAELKKILQKQTFQGSFIKTGREVRYKIINKIKEEYRLQKNNQWRYVYRRTRQTFGSRDDFFLVRPKPHHSWYALEKLAENRLVDEGRLPEKINDYSSWVYPKKYVTDEDCFPSRSRLSPEERLPRFTGRHLALLGKLFWHDAGKHLQGRYYLPIRQFVNYLAAFYSWILPPQKTETAELEEINDSRNDPEKLIMAGKKAGSILARQLTANWSNFQKKVMYYLYFSPEPETMAGLEKKLDTTRYHLEKADRDTRKQLEKFCREGLPGSMLQNSDQQEALDFLEEIKKICNQSKKDHIHQLKGDSIND